MENEIIFLVEEAAEGGYQARALGHSIFTEADTVEQLRACLKRLSQATIFRSWWLTFNLPTTTH